MSLAGSLDAEQRRAVEEGLTEDELALFDLACKDNITKADREDVKQGSRQLLAALLTLLGPMEQWTEKEQTQATVKVFILDRLYEVLPNPPYSPEETEEAAARIYDYVRERSASDRTWATGTAA